MFMCGWYFILAEFVAGDSIALSYRLYHYLNLLENLRIPRGQQDKISYSFTPFLTPKTYWQGFLIQSSISPRLFVLRSQVSEFPILFRP